MSTGTPEAARNHSRSRLASRAAPGLVFGVRAALAIAGAVGVLLVVVATFATVIEITVAGNANITAAIDRTASGWDRHNVALLLLGGFALVMLVGALLGGRPAMFALASCGVAVLLLAVVGDAPDLDKTGPIGDLYEDARAEAGNGFYFESLGGALLLIAGVGLLMLDAGTGGVRPATRAHGAVVPQDTTSPPGEAAHEATPVEPAPAAGPAETDAVTGTSKLGFEERLRQARERARRKP